MADERVRAVMQELHRLLGRKNESSLTDAQLLANFVTRRDELSFEVLVWRHGTMVFDLCRRILRDTHAAEDAFQATFLVCARKAGSIGRQEAVGSWLYKTAYRIALRNQAKAAKRSAREEPADDYPARQSSDETLWGDLRPVLDQEIARLPERFRVPVLLCLLEGRTTEEAAAQLECPQGTIKSRLARGRERLQARLVRRGVALSAGGLTTTLSQNAEALSAPLVSSTVKAALPFAAGKAAAGLVSGSVATLAEGMLRSLSLTKLKITAAAILALAVLTTTAGSVAHRVLADLSSQETVVKQDAEGNHHQANRNQRLDPAERPPRELSLAEKLRLFVRLQHQLDEQFRDRQYPEAVVTCRQMIQLFPERPESRYDLARALARQGEIAKALDSLDRAIAKGYADADSLREDDNLGPLRAQERFAELLARTRANRQRELSRFPRERGAELPGIRTVEGTAEDGLPYRLRLSEKAAPESPHRLVVWLQAPDGSMSDAAEALAPRLAERGFALLVLPQKHFGGCREAKRPARLLERTLAKVARLKEVDTRKPILFGHRAGGQQALDLWCADPERWGGLLLDAAYPVDVEENERSLPMTDGVQKSPLLVFVGTRDGGAKLWKKLGPRWREAGALLTIRPVEGKGKDWLIGKEETVVLQKWLEDLAAGKRPSASDANVATTAANPVWTTVELPKRAQERNLHDVFFVDDRHGWIVGAKGLCLATRDGGVSWEVQETGSAASLRCVRFQDAQNGWICGDGDPDAPPMGGPVHLIRSMKKGTLLCTTDGGKHWRSEWIPADAEVSWIETSAAPRLQVGVHPRAGGLDGGILSSPDGGKTWTSRPCFRGLFAARQIDNQRYLALGAAVALTYFNVPQHELLTNRTCRALISEDGGETWKVTRGSEGAGALRGMAVRKSVLAVGDKGTILRSDDGGAAWETVKSPTAEDLRGIAWSEDVAVAVGKYGTVVVATRDGKMWSETPTDETQTLLAVAAAGDSFIAVGNQGTVLRASAAQLAKLRAK
jgi:RNA polymerase sigma factor (sigma-70 family)